MIYVFGAFLMLLGVCAFVAFFVMRAIVIFIGAVVYLIVKAIFGGKSNLESPRESRQRRQSFYSNRR